MLIPGLTSVSFRKLSCSEIITMTKKAGLACIEWGSDIHVPHGNIINARAALANDANTLKILCEQ